MGVGMNQMMALTGAVTGAASAAAGIASKIKDEDGMMAKKARATRDAKIKTKKDNIKKSRVKIRGGKR